MTGQEVAGAALGPREGYSSEWGQIWRLCWVQSGARALNHLKGYARVRQTALILLEAPLGLTKHVALFQIPWWSVTVRRPKSGIQSVPLWVSLLP